MFDLGTLLTVILVVFYLYVGVRWERVKRPWCYMLGVTGIVLLLLGRFFGIGLNPSSGVRVVEKVFNVVGLLMAFKGAVGAVYGGKIPVWDMLVPPKGAEQQGEQEGPASSGM